MRPAAHPDGDPAEPRRRAAGAALVCLAVLGGVPAGAAAPSSPGSVHAVLINGGSRPQSNYLSHLHHLEDMVDLLDRRGIPRDRVHVFSADGEDPAEDLAVRDTLPPGFWLVDGLRVGRRLMPRTDLTDTRWPGMTLLPARKESLREWFAASGERLRPGDRLLLFVTDHGTDNKEDPDNGAISLWEEKITVEELREMLDLLPGGVQTVMAMSQCYSGTFAALMADGGEPDGEVCGFFSTLRDLRAHGCYPEGRDRDRLGHAFAFIEALGLYPSTGDAHRVVLVTDDTPDVPLRTSDVYLEQALSREAEARDGGFLSLVDELLERAWEDRGAWEPEIRLLDRIAAAFGTFSPRSLAEVEAYDEDLAAMVERMKTYGQRWEATLSAVKNENLTAFLEGRPDWRERLDAHAAWDAEGRRETLAELLPELETHARGRMEIWDRLQGLRSRAERASAAEWRLDVRRAALRRMRLILTGIAGRILLGPGPDGARTDRRRALEALESCEALEPGRLPGGALTAEPPTVTPFPPLAEDRTLLQEVLPSWLGVRFGAVPDGLREGREIPEGAAFLQAIYPDSPALEGGLEQGDVVLGPPGAAFRSYEQIREWTMTSPPGTPLRLAVVRPGDDPAGDRRFQATLTLRPYPLELPELPGPPEVGQAAPSLPSSLVSVGPEPLTEVTGREHLLVFWATWCGPCKAAVPELLAFSEARGTPILAISDESAEVVRGYLEKRKEPFYRQVALDPLRASFVSFGVNGTPTILLVDAAGRVRHRQVGYNVKEGLQVKDWDWSPPEMPRLPVRR